MTDDAPTTPAEPTGFPLATAAAALVGLFLFLGLVLVAYYSPNYLGGGPAESKPDPAAKLQDVRAKNQAVLDGADPAAKLSIGRATAEVLTLAGKSNGATSKYGRLPFPAEPKPATPDAKDKR